jgi:hypothetical protein
MPQRIENISLLVNGGTCLLPWQPNSCQQVGLETSNLDELQQGCSCANNSYHGPVANKIQAGKLEKIVKFRPMFFTRVY